MRKKEKRSKGDASQSRLQAYTSYDSKEVGHYDSGLSGPAYSDPYSPTTTDNTSTMSADSKTTGQGGQRQGRGRDGSKGPWFSSRQYKLFKKPPPAEQAAYSGPPRYDWVDIVSISGVLPC